MSNKSSPRSSKRHEDEEAVLLGGSSSENESRQENRESYDSALEKTGNGRFHYLLLLVCGLANASDAIEVLCISFLLPSAECDLKLTTSDKGWLSAMMFIGMLIGGYIWGSLADSLGRKKTLISAMIINAVCGFASAFSPTKAVFLACRFFSGFGVGGSIPVTWSYFAEFQPKDRRGSQMSILATFWMIGNISVAGLAWVVIPTKDGPNSDVYNGSFSWRLFTGLCAIPAALAGIFLLFFPESPKYLLSKGHDKSALKVLKKMYNCNNASKPNFVDFAVAQLEPEARAHSPNRRLRRSSWMKLFKSKVKEVASNTADIFILPTVRGNTLKMLYINFAIAFGYYGLWMWFPELFNKLDKYYKYHQNETETVSVCDVTSFVPPSSKTDDNQFCSSNSIPSNSVFLNSFLISVSALPGNLWTIFHMDVLGRKFFLVLSMVLSGVSAFLIYLVTSQTTNLVISCLFGVVSTMGFNALDCLGAEVFPTNLRSTAMAVTLAAGRLGAILANVVFGYMITVNCAVPILSVAVLLISGGLLGLFLPKTTNVSLH